MPKVSRTEKAWPQGLAPPPLRRPRLSQDVIDEFKRRRVAEAVAKVAHEEGLEELTISKITARARMARATLYELFSNKWDCVAFACERGVDDLVDCLPNSFPSDQGPQARLALLVPALVRAVEERPLTVELILLHSRRLEARGLRSYEERIVEVLIGLIGEDRFAELTARALLAAISLWLMRVERPDLTQFEEGLVALAQ